MLSQLAEKVLPLPIKSSLLSYCPSMDLIAAALQDEQIKVYRLNGQEVFEIARRKDGSPVTALCWKPDGRTLAVAYASNTVILVSSHSGKTISQTSYAEQTTSPICTLKWDVAFIDPRGARVLLEREGSKTIDETAPKGVNLLDEALAKGLRDLDIDIPLDLPTDLGSLDVETSLPKLSTLPPGGKDEEVFSARVSLDALFHTAKKDANDTVDVLSAGFEDGTGYMSVYDSFEIGRFTTLTTEPGLRTVRHCSHPYVTTLAWLLADDFHKPKSLTLAPVDLKFARDGGRYLSLLAAKSTQLQNLLRYMKQTILQIATDFRTSQELPRKFMRSVEEDLNEKEQDSLANVAFHLVATGQCSAVLKGWLTDELGERGYRRWEKAATSGYEGVCRYTLQNLLPALDRFAILLSRVRGVARLLEDSTIHGLNVPDLNRVFDSLSCLRLTAHHVLKAAGSELRDFAAFAQWMKLEIEAQSTDPLSTSVDELPACYAALDYPSIIGFIQGPMQHSELTKFCGERSKSDSQPAWIGDKRELIYDDLKKVLAKQAGEDKIPSLHVMMSRLEDLTEDMFSAIAQAQRRKIRVGTCVKIDAEHIGAYDMTMTFDAFTANGCTCDMFVAYASGGRPEVTLHKSRYSTTNGMSTLHGTEAGRIRLPSGFLVQDVRFADDSTLLVLVSDATTDDQPLIAYLPFRGYGSLSYSSTAKGPTPVTMDLASDGAFGEFVKHRFDKHSRWMPHGLEVNGRKDRRALCVIERDGLQYQVFDLDSAGVEEAEQGGKGEEMEVE